MKWLIITDKTDSADEINTLLLNFDKANKTISSDLNGASLKKIKSNLKNIAACIIYIENQDKLSLEDSMQLSSILGYLSYDEVTLITNVSALSKNAVFTKNIHTDTKTTAEISALISKKYNSITQDAVTRLAKKKLLDRGIPFTSDCFATYIAKNKIEVVNEFLEAGMSVNSRDDMGVPMLNIACRNDNFEFVNMIFDLGAELNAVSEDRGYTAVMDAVWRGNEKITKYLIEKGADLNTINKEGQTNLILAVGANRENIVKLLAENGADPDVKDMMGMSAYTYATLFKKQRIIDILSPYHKS